ncbi:MurR/RpiR family transcriptional regulator [Nocardiopsis lambiniae]|uniref:MurR/RpiR family transcriptional regulator n=1 Tax=Nocardiopsis lambiniae TaxID=3075539 RepID=A0ABU2MD30_9ACTN|nr:MurR/RpiR family transcriptional regulator [Nocardiopsis sp. DSM 44743]MDT0329826.1 MurR/RpiR family transcriptional regulator [Nocardiopsis sp. DSM 44743]
MVRTREGGLSTGERRVARALLADYPTAGLETVRLLAERAGVSGPTVLRFVSRLGFESYPAFQRRLLDELGERERSPLQAYTSSHSGEPRDTGGADLPGTAARVLSEAVRTTLEGLPAFELGEAVRLLSEPEHRIVSWGGRFSRLQSHYLVLHLMQIRGRAVALPDTPVERADLLSEAGRKDVFVVFDFRRYEAWSLKAAEEVSRREAKVVLVTDRWLSPISAVADVVLPVHVDSVSAYDSQVPVTAVCEVLVAGVMDSLEGLAEGRMRRFEEASRTFGLL